MNDDAREAAAILSLWEAGRDVSPAERRRRLWAWTRRAPYSALLEETPGARERDLWRLRVQLFGPRGEALVPCPRCGEQLEVPVDVSDLLALPDPTSGTHTVEIQGETYSFRLPTVGDLERGGDLLRACVGPVALTDDARAGIEAAMEDRDPLADVTVVLDCALCGARWRSSLDAAAWLWAELDRAAQSLFAEIDAIARVYHWSEAEILSLSPARRRAYLARVLS